jgi:hypothetical protein
VFKIIECFIKHSHSDDKVHWLYPGILCSFICTVYVFILNQAWWYTPVIPALGRLMQEDLEFTVSLGYGVRPNLKKKKKKERKILKSYVAYSSKNHILNKLYLPFKVIHIFPFAYKLTYLFYLNSHGFKCQINYV